MGHRTKSADPDHDSPDVFMKAVLAIRDNVRIVRTYDIPFLAGISRSGWTVYIDRDLPSNMILGSGSIRTDEPLVLHEWIEYLIEKFGGALKQGFLAHLFATTGEAEDMAGSQDSFSYALSHQLAQHLEKQAVEYQGIDWSEYTAAMDVEIARAGKKKLRACPPDLYLQPYEDDAAETGDVATLEAIRSAGGPESYMLLPVGQQGGKSGAPFYEDT
jgi:hypothetical protein